MLFQKRKYFKKQQKLIKYKKKITPQNFNVVPLLIYDFFKDINLSQKIKIPNKVFLNHKFIIKILATERKNHSNFFFVMKVEIKSKS